MKIFICGMGLLGTSLALALRSYSHSVAGCEKDSESRKVLSEMGFSHVYDPADSKLWEEISASDALVFATPVNQIPGLLQDIKKKVKSFQPDFWMTDMASTKAELMLSIGDQAGPMGFVGSHPMAGSDLSGPSHARPALFKGAAIYVTPAEGIDDPEYRKKVESVKAFWESIEANPVEISFREHDKWAAYLSHGLHLVSCMVAHLLKDIPTVLESEVNPAGGSFRDITRVAGSNPKLWDGIIESNKNEVVNYLASLEDLIGDWRKKLESDKLNVEEIFAEAADLRQKLMGEKA